MKAADFDYSCAASIPEACRLLAGAHGEGRIIAGGQTLVPLLAMRLARPALLVDITRIPDLRRWPACLCKAASWPRSFWSTRWQTVSTAR